MKKSYGEKKKDKNFIGIEYEFENRIDVPNWCPLNCIAFEWNSTILFKLW